MQIQTLSTLGNCSDRMQTRWTVLPVPQADADMLPMKCQINGYGALKGKKVGSATQLFYVLASNFAPYGLTAGKLQPVGPEFRVPSFRLADAVKQNHDSLIPRLRVKADGVSEEAEIKIVSTVESNPLRLVVHMRGRALGVWCDMWVTIWTGQSVIDIKGAVRWSDRTSLEWKKQVQAVDILVGQEMHLYYALRMGFNIIDGGWNLVGDDYLPDGMMIPFRGVLLPRRSDVEDAAEEEAIAAAKGGPITGSLTGAKEWPGIVVDPPGDLGTVYKARDEFLTYLRKPGFDHWADAKPLALNKRTTDAGSQYPFGARKDGLLAGHGSPFRLFELQLSADDYLLRPHHHLEEDGSRVMAEKHPDWRTWSGETFTRISQDLLGKRAEQPEDWQHGRHGPDDQHDGYLPIACVEALTGDEMLASGRADMLQTDLAMVPGRTGAPRAMGRLCQKWATWIRLSDSADDVAQIVRMAELKLVEWEKARHVGTEVRPAQTGGPDPRVLPSMDPYWVPWQDSLCVLGMWQMADTLFRFHYDALGERFRNYAMAVAENHVRWGVRDYEGETYPLNGVKWLITGEANDEEYYDLGREGTNWRNPLSHNLLIGDMGWWSWHAPSMLVAKVSLDQPVADRAGYILERYLNSRQLPLAEWTQL